MTGPNGFSFTERKNGEGAISHHHRVVTVLRGHKARSFLAKIAEGNGQELMARVTGNYKRGNERG